MNKERMEEEIKKRGLSKRAFARMIGVSENKLWRRINNRVGLELKDAKKMCEALNLDPVTAYEIFLKTE